jgi:hypothetical protein
VSAWPAGLHVTGFRQQRKCVKDAFAAVTNGVGVRAFMLADFVAGDCLLDTM